MKLQLEKQEYEDVDTAISIRDAAGSQKTQNDQVKELIDAGCNVLCVNLVERADPSEIIDLAREMEVPIIFSSIGNLWQKILCSGRAYIMWELTQSSQENFREK